MQVDLDSGLIVLQKAHQTLHHCIEQLVQFIDYSSAIPQTDESGTLIVPDKSTYVKIIFP